ncbi:MAG: CAP domain-containing protein [Candidatus Parvarchaeota archaeon]|nr:CAP domain-containing protein [Candidatus Jingweiarchaeum tengchongense]MCW1300092.1 CAP domain-containing protein [Candidatus Jingweiarchaeum tengchongense]MCW1304446.1 CAP domain-containing protein [Candidatus Jingweiarchaeum tengchongense]MCW1305613.1 CAP domain-containing protein [Candidatus Jingweiarchaeum tengchongense]MCW1309266.1 CAP domain-containing protein [Candidatus Jingweiarchaeum tengchongense]
MARGFFKIFVLLILIFGILYFLYSNENPFVKQIFEETLKSIQEKYDRYALNESKKAFDKINEIRYENGKSKLVWDDRLYELAKYRAKDMYDRGYYSHITPEGKTVNEIADSYGIYTDVGENLGKGYISPSEAIEGWMNSPAHKYNLLYDGHRLGAFAYYMDIYVFLATGSGSWTYELGILIPIQK